MTTRASVRTFNNFGELRTLLTSEEQHLVTPTRFNAGKLMAFVRDPDIGAKDTALGAIECDGLGRWLSENSSAGNSNPDVEAVRLAYHLHLLESPYMTALFGSRARGDFRPDSDVDIMMITSEDTDIDHGAELGTRLAGLNERLYGITLDVDVMAISIGDFRKEQLLKGSMISDILLEGVVLSPEIEKYISPYDIEDCPALYDWVLYDRNLKLARDALRYIGIAYDMVLPERGVDRYDISFLSHVLSSPGKRHGHIVARAVYLMEYALRMFILASEDILRINDDITVIHQKASEILPKDFEFQLPLSTYLNRSSFDNMPIDDLTAAVRKDYKQLLNLCSAKRRKLESDAGRLRKIWVPAGHGEAEDLGNFAVGQLFARNTWKLTKSMDKASPEFLEDWGDYLTPQIKQIARWLPPGAHKKVAKDASHGALVVCYAPFQDWTDSYPRIPDPTALDISWVSDEGVSEMRIGGLCSGAVCLQGYLYGSQTVEFRNEVSSHPFRSCTVVPLEYDPSTNLQEASNLMHGIAGYFEEMLFSATLNYTGEDDIDDDEIDFDDFDDDDFVIVGGDHMHEWIDLWEEANSGSR